MILVIKFASLGPGSFYRDLTVLKVAEMGKVMYYPSTEICTGTIKVFILWQVLGLEAVVVKPCASMLVH